MREAFFRIGSRHSRRPALFVEAAAALSTKTSLGRIFQGLSFWVSPHMLRKCT